MSGLSASFPRSSRQLEDEGFGRWTLRLAVAVALVLLWGAWFFCARVSIYATSRSARLETLAAAHPLGAPAGGRVTAVHMELDQEVRAGDVLLELDAEVERLQLKEEEARRDALVRQLEGLALEEHSEEDALREMTAGRFAALDEAERRTDEAKARSDLAGEEAGRMARLHRDGLLSQVDLLRARAHEKELSAAADASAGAHGRLIAEQRLREATQRAHLAQLAAQRAAIHGQRAAVELAVARLREGLERRMVRAPVAGRVAEIAAVRAGTVVDQGQRLGVIVPPGELRAVASFEPADALGRIRPGQKARLRLDGFPWTEFGSVAAAVQRVGGEPQREDGRIRVELSVERNPSSLIPYSHGLSGTAEVEVERSSPAALALRAAGRMLRSSGSAVPIAAARRSDS